MFKRLKDQVSPYAAKFRERVDILTNKHEKIAAVIESGVGFIFSILSSFAAGIFLKPYFFFPALLLAMGIMYAWQWAVLTNRRIKETNEILNLLADENDVVKDKARENEKKQTDIALDWLDTQTKVMNGAVTLCHAVAHQSKYVTQNLQDQGWKSARHELIVLLASVLNSMEDVFSSHYEKKISASIKAIDQNKKVVTLGRGRRNIASRGGEIKAAALNKEEISYSDNYAYTVIIDDGARFFSEKNVDTFESRKNENDLYNREHNDIPITATVVVPIRVYHGPKNNDVVGLICIDCPEEITEWDPNEIENTPTYEVIATVADSLYAPLDAFRAISVRRSK